MPNHCDNTTSIFGPESEVQNIYKSMFMKDSNGELKFNICNLIPCPDDLKIEAVHLTDVPPSSWKDQLDKGQISQQEYEDLLKKREQDIANQERNLQVYGYRHWFDWCVDNWGTKWGDYDHYYVPTEVEVNGDIAEIKISYHTAWGPFNENFWGKVSEMYPNCIFTTTFYEFGMNFLGGIVAKNGMVLLEEEEIEFEWSDDPDDSEFQESLDFVDQRTEEVTSSLMSNLLREINATE